MTEIALLIAQLSFKWNCLFLFVGLLAVFSAKVIGPRLSAASFRAAHRAALLCLLFAPLLLVVGEAWIPTSNVFEPAVQIATAVQDENSPVRPGSPTLHVSSLNAAVSNSSDWLAYGAYALALITLVSFGARVLRWQRDRRVVAELISTAFCLRQQKSLRVLISDRVSTPFACRHRGRALVFIPEALLADWTSMKMALHHELQHIRSGDLSWAWLPEVARAVAGWNPFVRYWMDRIEEQDELACDEALLGRRGFDHRAYATCLYEVARAATQTERIARPSGTVGMAVAPNFLKRRIEMSLQEMRPTSKWSGRVLVAALTTVTAFSAWAGKSLISDRRITERAAQEYAKKAQASSEIPIVVNEQVLHWLNQTTATSRKRFWMRNALKRMRTFEPMIRAKLAAAQLPAELMAVPLIETGYQNTETTTAAGIWSFVPQTARNFGLEVSDERDERMDPVKETEAAVRYYLSLQKRFSDWNLSLLSYNAGESQVEKWVLTSGIRDVYRLADEGVITNQENKNYVPKLMAALIIMKNPDLVRD